jgi:hypothetical protein
MKIREYLLYGKIISIFASLFISSVIYAAELGKSKVDITPFLEKGCKLVKKSEGKFGSLDCSAIGLEKRFNCEALTGAPNELGGLSPSLPIIECWIRPGGNPPEMQGIESVGCLLCRYIQYIAYINGEFQKIDSKEAFTSMFAPVSSPEEALGFAIALTDLHPKYDSKIPEDMIVETTEIHPTFIEKSGENHLVNLFGFDACGCGPHWFYSMQATVSKEGVITVDSRKNLYRDPKDDDLCID